MKDVDSAVYASQQAEEEGKDNSRSHHSKLLIPLVLLIVGILTVAGLTFAYLKNRNQEDSMAGEWKDAIAISPTPDPTADWVEYRNQENGFSFKYPPDFVLDDKDFSVLPEKNESGQSNLCYIPFNSLYLTDKQYEPRTQSPEITFHIVSTTEKIQSIIDDCYEKEMKEWNDFAKEKYGDAIPSGPQLLSQEKTTIVNVSAIEVERMRAPNAPNTFETQYYFKVNDTVYIATARYGAKSVSKTENLQDIEEREVVVLDQILSTLKIFKQGENIPFTFNSGYDDVRYSLSLPSSCYVIEQQEQFEYPGGEITCVFGSSSVNIYPSAGGRGSLSKPEVSSVQLGSYTFEKRFFPDEDGVTMTTYGVTDEKGNYYLIEVRYDVYSADVEGDVENIVSTFKIVN